MRKCGYLNCHGEKSETSKLSVCGGCRDICYCSRECQKLDWNLRHKSSCWQTKFPLIMRALSVAIFGSVDISAAKSPYESLVNIENHLQKSENQVTNNSPSDCMVRVGNVLAAVYISPLVEYSIEVKGSTRTQFALFSPFCYHGSFADLKTAQEKLKGIWMSLCVVKNFIGPDQFGFTLPNFKDQGLTSLSWIEHAMIAVFLTYHDKDIVFDEWARISEIIERDNEKRKGLEMSLPRDELPVGIIYLNDSEFILKRSIS